jgi:hypothetical protein
VELGKVVRWDGSGGAFAYSSATSGFVGWECEAAVYSEIAVS